MTDKNDKLIVDGAIFMCGPQSRSCKCNCPKSCEHDFTGPVVEFDEGRGGTVTCKKCGMWAINHDIWVLP